MKTKLVLVFIIPLIAVGACNKIKNKPPIISSLTADANTVEVKKRTTITCAANDPDEDKLFYYWEASSGIICGTGSSIIWTAFGAEETSLISCMVWDGHGGKAIEFIEINVIKSTKNISNYSFWVNTRGGITQNIDSSANTLSYFNLFATAIDVYEDRFFVFDNWDRKIREYDKKGNILNTVFIPQEYSGINFTVLPDSRFALFDNWKDQIHFINSNGIHLQTISMLVEPNTSNQNVNGVVVDNFLIVSENGNNQLLRIDLNSYEVSVFKDFSNLKGWLGAISYDDGIYYICQSKKIYAFTDCQNENLFLIREVDEYNICGIAIVNNYAYVTINHAGIIYKVNIFSGQTELFKTQLNYPEDIEVW